MTLLIPSTYFMNSFSNEVLFNKWNLFEKFSLKKKINEKKENIKEGYSTYSISGNDNKSIDSYNAFLINKPSTECQKIFGFDGIYCSPTSSPEKIDAFYGLSSNTTCEGSGLTKSGGNLCLDAKSKELLTSRGNNATGIHTTSTKDSQIA